MSTLRWFGHAECTDDIDCNEQYMTIETNEIKQTEDSTEQCQRGYEKFLACTEIMQGLGLIEKKNQGATR